MYRMLGLQVGNPFETWFAKMQTFRTHFPRFKPCVQESLDYLFISSRMAGPCWKQQLTISLPFRSWLIVSLTSMWPSFQDRGLEIMMGFICWVLVYKATWDGENGGKWGRGMEVYGGLCLAAVCDKGFCLGIQKVPARTKIEHRFLPPPLSATLAGMGCLKQKHADAKQSRIRPDQSARHLLTILQTDSGLEETWPLGPLLQSHPVFCCGVGAWKWPACPDGMTSLSLHMVMVRLGKKKKQKTNLPYVLKVECLGTLMH